VRHAELDETLLDDRAVALVRLEGGRLRLVGHEPFAWFGHTGERDAWLEYRGSRPHRYGQLMRGIVELLHAGSVDYRSLSDGVHGDRGERHTSNIRRAVKTLEERGAVKVKVTFTSPYPSVRTCSVTLAGPAAEEEAA